MSRIDELIAGLCPSGVEYQAIGDFGEPVRGNGMPKSDFVESGGRLFSAYVRHSVIFTRRSRNGTGIESKRPVKGACYFWFEEGT